MTVSMWVKLDTITNWDTIWYIGNCGDNSNNGDGVYIRSGSNTSTDDKKTLVVTVEQGTTTNDQYYEDFFANELGNWVHIAVKFSASGETKVYKNSLEFTRTRTAGGTNYVVPTLTRTKHFIGRHGRDAYYSRGEILDYKIFEEFVDLNTTNFWNYVNDNFNYALTGTTIRWEGGANGTDHPDITINLENGYILNITNLWFLADYAKGAWNRGRYDSNGNERSTYSTWWIEDLIPGKTYQYELYNYNSASSQQYSVSFDVVGISTNSHTFVQDTSISATVTDVIAPDANGKIFFNTTNDGLHGASLAWIRIRPV